MSDSETAKVHCAGWTRKRFFDHQGRQLFALLDKARPQNLLTSLDNKYTANGPCDQPVEMCTKA